MQDGSLLTTILKVASIPFIMTFVAFLLLYGAFKFVFGDADPFKNRPVPAADVRRAG